MTHARELWLVGTAVPKSGTRKALQNWHALKRDDSIVALCISFAHNLSLEHRRTSRYSLTSQGQHTKAGGASLTAPDFSRAANPANIRDWRGTVSDRRSRTG